MSVVSCVPGTAARACDAAAALRAAHGQEGVAVFYRVFSREPGEHRMTSQRNDPDGLAAALQVLGLKSRTLRAIRGFFFDRGFTEVETPVRLPAPALELNIDAEPSGKWYLRTSPELHMKRLLAAGCERIFQIGPCFRLGETGRLHNPEYTMLEWYRAGAGHLDVLVDAKALMIHIAREAIGGTVLSLGRMKVDLAGEWIFRTVADAFSEYAGWNPLRKFDADRFDLDMVDKVEPALPKDRPVVLGDYPAEVAALARRKPSDPRVAERWELYIRGVELANAFGELTDQAEQRARFEKCAAERGAAGKPVYPIDEKFLACLSGMPQSAGVALGVDRLVMLLAGLDSLDRVLPFRGDT